jgi:hypothetical protein
VLADRIGPTVQEVATPVTADELPESCVSITISEAISRAKAAAGV